jgi:ferredoxin
MAVKITIDKDKCVGAGVCVGLAPEVFQFDDDDKATVITPEGAPLEDVKEAEQRCPAQAITVEEI